MDQVLIFWAVVVRAKNKVQHYSVLINHCHLNKHYKVHTVGDWQPCLMAEIVETTFVFLTSHRILVIFV